MQISMTKCKKKLATLWFLGAAVPFLIIFFQTIMGHYDNQSEVAWNWFLPTIFPTLSLIIGVLVIEASSKGMEEKTVNRFLFILSFSLSLFYLLTVTSTILLSPIASADPFKLMGESHFWLGPFQGLVSASLGAFFVKKEPE
jgi:hypothetical protein